MISRLQQCCLKLISKNRSTCDGAESIKSKIKLFPLIKKKTVLVEDYVKQGKLCDAAISKLTIIKAKIKSGQDISTSDIDEVTRDFEDQHADTIGVSHALHTSLNKALALMESYSSKSPKTISSMQSDASKLLGDCKDISSKAKNPSTALALARAYSDIFKTKCDDYFRWPKRY